MNFINTIHKLLILGVLLFLANALSAQNKDIDSLEKALKSEITDAQKLEANNILAQKYMFIDGDKSLKYADDAITLADKLGDLPAKALALKTKGNVYYRSSNYTVAFELYQQSFNIASEGKDNAGMAVAKRNMGSVYSQMGNYNKAMDSFLESLKMYTQMQDSVNISNVYRNLGTTFQAIGELESAKKYFNNALRINTLLNNAKGIAEDNYNLGTLLLIEIGSLNDEAQSKIKRDSARMALNIAYSTFKDIDDVRNIARCAESLAQMYLHEKPDSSLYFINISLSIYKELGNLLGDAKSYNFLISYYTKMKNDAKVLEYFKKAEAIADDSIDNKELLKEIYYSIATFYYTRGDYKNAFRYKSSYYELKDSLIREDDVKKSAQMESQLQFEEELKQRELDEKKRQIEQDAQLKRQKMVTYFFILGFGLMIILAIVIFRSFKQKQQANQLLESKNNLLRQQQEEILTKNMALQQSKEEIEAQRDEIEIHRNKVVEEKDKVEHANKQIKDSIYYAKRIQTAVITPVDVISSMFKDVFILFRPRDIVSGDFFWATKKGKYRFITAADCTGHGVPGAFMSMLGISLLNEIMSSIDVDNDEITAALFLNDLRNQIKQSLRQTGKDDEAKDGMDMAFCVFDFENKKGQYAGAHNPLIVIRDGEVIQYKADRMPIGIHIKEKETFTNCEFDIQLNDSFYIFSDGIVDQFGGSEGKKFMIKQLKDLLAVNAGLPMHEQKVIYENTFENWLGHRDSNGSVYEQIDDVLLIGIKYVE